MYHCCIVIGMMNPRRIVDGNNDRIPQMGGTTSTTAAATGNDRVGYHGRTIVIFQREA